MHTLLWIYKSLNPNIFSDLRKPGLVPGKSLSLSTKINYVLEKYLSYIKHVKYIIPTDRYINQLPDYSGFGRKTTLRINPNQIPDLHWKLTNSYHTTNIGQTDAVTTSIYVHSITVNPSGGEYKTSLSTETYTTQSRHEPLICSVMPIV